MSDPYMRSSEVYDGKKHIVVWVKGNYRFQVMVSVGGRVYRHFSVSFDWHIISESSKVKKKKFKCGCTVHFRDDTEKGNGSWEWVSTGIVCRVCPFENHHPQPLHQQGLSNQDLLSRRERKDTEGVGRLQINRVDVVTRQCLIS